MAPPDKMHLAPLRLLHAMALVYVVLTLQIGTGTGWLSFRRAFELCGKHSLEVFSLGTVLAFVGTLDVPDVRRRMADAGDRQRCRPWQHGVAGVGAGTGAQASPGAGGLAAFFEVRGKPLQMTISIAMRGCGWHFLEGV